MVLLKTLWIFFFASMGLHGVRNPEKGRASYHVIRTFPRDLEA